jgi:hypothetical protein
MQYIKKLIVIYSLVLIPNKAFAQQTYTEEEMYKKTGEALAKFYGLDVIGQEAFRRVQEQIIPKEYHYVIPYFGTFYSIVVDQKFTFKKEF